MMTSPLRSPAAAAAPAFGVPLTFAPGPKCFDESCTPNHARCRIWPSFIRWSNGAISAIVAAKLTTLTGLKLGLKAIAARSAAKLGSVGIAKGAAAAGVKAGGKLGVKAGVRGGSVLASGTSATVLCSPLGLAAPVCGIAAATMTWFAVDKAIVEVDEFLNREDFEERLSVELNGLMDEIEGDVIKGLDEYQKSVLDTLIKSEVKRLDTPPKETRLIDQISPPPKELTTQP